MRDLPDQCASNPHDHPIWLISSSLWIDLCQIPNRHCSHLRNRIQRSSPYRTARTRLLNCHQRSRRLHAGCQIPLKKECHLPRKDQSPSDLRLPVFPSPGLGKDQGQRSDRAQCSVARLSMMELNSAGRKRSQGVRFGLTLRMSAGRSLSGPPPRAGPMIQVGTFSRVHSGYIFRA